MDNASYAEKRRLNLLKKEAAGRSILNTLVNNLSLKINLPGHNFTGPGTKLYKRLNSDETPKEWSIAINRVANAANPHD